MKKIALVVGHRKNAQGAWGNAGVSEFKYNSHLAEAIKDKLDQVGFGGEVKIFFRDDLPGGYGEKMKRLHKRIDEWGADYSVSMHFNAAGRQDVNGHEVLYCSKTGRKVAEIFDEALDHSLKNKDRKIKKKTRKDRGGGFLCRGKSVCVLVEPFFAAHQKEYMPGTPGYDALLHAYANAIIRTAKEV
ncbi:N-acetylmuramoyl-L-alanine amidase family protein [Nitratifractor salsuginis]|uniref:N-acetylmuramoyl-L-alanine amidase n=1 Tax=Nitratifractor salsuginis (strain DSM 16511 / JCM 12458 / E9I37-1) TaxID=749222 RepID=E6WYD4_NITSE|nr:N-acetylmuramoyl-L-alanine amidase [Nitratifractor salsuginis]ADV46446.1 cell wall hydrolase/autolysin [Nitratifractor salsuginis DSM 16511]